MSIVRGVPQQLRSLMLITVGCLIVSVCGTALLAAQREVKYWAGQAVAPVYEGHEVNPDGTLTLWFAYLNRNYEEALDIPIGPNNMFEPGPADRGQPTHFLSRRHKSVFSVVVPKDFAGTLAWTLTVGGKTEVATVNLPRSAIVDHHHGTVNSKDGDPLNTPPVVTVSTPEQTISLPASALLTVHASDDGLPKSQPPRVTGGLSVQWSKYRGPGHVTFNPVKVSVKNAAASTTAGFSDPGVYVVQATVDDGSAGFGEYCCWTNVSMTVIVTSGKEQQAIR